MPTQRTMEWAERWSDPWRVYWAERLRAVLRPATIAFGELLHLSRESVGAVPAVYFTRLRMGSVPYLSWADGSPDIELAFPWKPDAKVPPFTCFAPTIEEADESRFALITRVASIVDGLLIGERRQLPRCSAPELEGARASALSWSDDDRAVTVIDEWIFRALDIRRTTAAFVIPPPEQRRSDKWFPYVPLLYFHSSAPYDTDEAEAILRAAMLAFRADDFRAKKYLEAKHQPQIAAIRAGILATLQAAHVRAREWLNQKTQLLSRAGYEGLKHDLVRRIGSGEQYASVFFDIDNFKKANVALDYDGADVVAAALTDRALAFMQREVSRSFAEYAESRQRTRAYAGPSPDGFRALLAHVSGDEFRFFIRCGTAELSPALQESGVMAFTQGLVRAVEGRVEPIAGSRADAAAAARSAAKRNLTGDEVRDKLALQRRTTVSAGFTQPRWDGTLSPQQVFTVLNRADSSAEEAARTAKARGKNRVVQRRFRRPSELASAASTPAQTQRARKTPQ
jgi:GGDEF domain-containing protein